MSMTATYHGVLTRSDAVLRILQVLDAKESAPVERLLLEGMAYMTQQSGYDDKNCRVLRAFDDDASRLGLHESIAYLQQMDRVKHAAGCYVLTDLGGQRLEAIDLPPELDTDNEETVIRSLAQFVRRGLSL